MIWMILWLTGIAAGAAVAAGLFTFLAITGVAHRLMAFTHTTDHNTWYEWMLIIGGVAGNILWLTTPTWKIGWAAVGIAGLLIGIFVGCLIGAIAEVLEAFPVFMHRIRIKKGVGIVVLGMAAGKAVGAWLWYFVL